MGLGYCWFQQTQPDAGTHVPSRGAKAKRFTAQGGHLEEGQSVKTLSSYPGLLMFFNVRMKIEIKNMGRPVYKPATSLQVVGCLLVI